MRQLIQELDIAALDNEIKRACQRAGKRVIGNIEWGTTIKQAFPVKVECGTGSAIVYKANPIGPSKSQYSQLGLPVQRDQESAAHGMVASLSTSKARRKKMDSGRPGAAS